MSAADVVVILLGVVIVVLLVVFLVKVSARGLGNEIGGGGTGFSFLTGFHDLQPKDKQEAIETIIEEKAGKKAFADGTSAAPRKAGTTHESEQTHN